MVKYISLDILFSLLSQRILSLAHVIYQLYFTYKPILARVCSAYMH
jgi:hypothetical protein